MPTFDSFNFENRLIQRLEEISALDQTLPQRPQSAHVAKVFVDLDQPHSSSVAHANDSPIAPDQQRPDLTQTANHFIQCETGNIWIQGNVLLCGCPDCSAPMTIRMWLQLADCWRCGTSISLTEEQVRAAQQLAGQSLPAPPPEFPFSPEPSAIQTGASETYVDRDLPAPPPVFPFSPVSPKISSNVSPVIQPSGVESATDGSGIDPRARELADLTRGSFASRVIRRSFNLTPAWLVSFMLHLIAILILAMIILGDGPAIPERITLSTFLDSQREHGGHIRMENPLDALQDDLVLASKLETSDQEVRQVLEKASQDAREMVVDPYPRAPLPDLSAIKRNITTRPDQMMSFAARDPRVRAEVVRSEGGTTITEAAVARGLRWLASVQNRDGSWSLKEYRKHDRPNNEGDIMGTSLALLPLLGAGQTHEYGIYKQNVSSGLAWLIENQKPNGDLRAGYEGQAGMYAHGQATIVLCEVLAMTGDQRFREPAQLAIKFIELAQHGRGGWRYKPGEAGDTSVFGWQMMALQSARSPQLNLEVDEATLKLADYFLEQVIAPAHFKDRDKTPLPEGAAYCYQKGRGATPAMTAEAILCRMYLGWKHHDPRLSAAIKWLISEHLPNDKQKNLYYWYYGTQVMHHYGGDSWKIWNKKMRELLISTQETRGSYPGSWNPAEFEWGNRGGRIYTTSLAVCTLEVYYRHLPIFKQIELHQ